MADHPFSNAGLSMFGSAERQFAQGSMQGSDKKDGLLKKATGALLKASGIQDFLDKIGISDNESVSGAATSLPVAPNYSVVPPTAISSEGINPMRIPNAVQGGIGLNAVPAGAVNPFQFQTTPLPKSAPDDEHKNQVQSAWS